MKRILFAFKVYYLLYVLAAFTAMLNGYAWLNIATLVLTAFGVIVIVYACIQTKFYKNAVGFWWVAAFLLSHIFSSVMSVKYGITGNLKEFFWLAFPMLILYSMSFLYTKAEILKEMKILSLIYVLWCTAASLVSLSMLWWGRNYAIGDGSGGYKVIGFKWGRLWGVFDDPNHGATIIAAGIILSVYLITTAKKKYVKALLGLAIFMQYFYIVFSDSRTGEITLVTAIFVFSGALAYRTFRSKGRAFLIGTTILLTFILAGSVLGVSYGTKKVYNKTEQVRLAAEKAKAAKTAKTNKKGTASKQQKPKVPQLGREQDIEKDVSNGRISIWKSGLDIAFTSPLYGVSFRNMTEYARENLPKTYIVHTPGGGNYDSLHNTVMDLFVSQGILGILIIGGFIVSIFTALKFWNTTKVSLGHDESQRALKEKDDNFSFNVTCFAIVLSLAAGSMFLSMVIYLNSPQAYIFWACLGYLVSFVLGKDRKVKRGRKVSKVRKGS